ncbi:hypothetical protein [Amycolatopsis anabasis]|uniref:hypothetical protein n=1 Tax=Amycolatopsis anabasis TaxID=1840409 RepID=UPI00131C350D|nr:hypothetical protein [Amycolatopsis anabasis]
MPDASADPNGPLAYLDITVFGWLNYTWTSGAGQNRRRPGGRRPGSEPLSGPSQQRYHQFIGHPRVGSGRTAHQSIG